MSTSFHYDSRDHHQPLNRQNRFWGYLVALGLLILAAIFIYRYFTDWTGVEGGAPEWLKFAAGFAAGVLAVLIIGFISVGYRRMGYSEYQYLKMDDAHLRWLFSCKKGPQELAIAQIASATEDPRHLIIKTKSGEEVWLENYLLIDPEEWEKFILVARERLPIVS
ncbi:MAG: hypothetical protein AAFU67_10165 [Bacteroidota bacterium]